MVEKNRSPWIAGILSLFTLGLGHVYCGKAKKGVSLFFVGQFLMVISFFLLLINPPIGIILSITIIFSYYIFCIKDSIRIAKVSKHSYILKKYNKWYIYLLCWFIASFFINSAVGYAIKNNISRAYKIPSSAMKPTLQIGDHILTNICLFRILEPQRGDIVVFPFPEDPSKDFIKRIVGVGGDTIEVKNKQLYINSEPYKEVYIVNNDKITYPKNAQPRDNFGPIVIPDNSFFVMGDNRDFSYDSRFWGFVEKSSIRGKAISIYWSWNKDEFQVRWNRIGKKII